MITMSHVSCGVKQIYGLHERTVDEEKMPFEGVLRAFSEYLAAVFLFSDHVDFNGRDTIESVAHKTHRGPEFAEWLTANDLGAVHVLPDAINPNTGHTIRVWAWYPDRKKTCKLLDEYFTPRVTRKPKKVEATLQPGDTATITLSDVSRADESRYHVLLNEAHRRRA
jgi:hypothetical protein